jgi:hypothetical protein
MAKYLFEDKIYETLKKYMKPKEVSREDYGILEKYSTTGMILWSYTTVEEEGKKVNVPVAKLSPLARRMVQRERIWRNPITRFLYNIINSI